MTLSNVEWVKACGNDGLWQCYQPPLRSKLWGIDPKAIKKYSELCELCASVVKTPSQEILKSQTT
jgi:hypothetical protein